MRTALQKLYIPSWPYWSFGERLPVVERPGELEDPLSIGAAYARLASLIDNHLDWRAIDRSAEPYELEETCVAIGDWTKRAEKAETRAKKAEKRSSLFIRLGAAAALTVVLAVVFGVYAKLQLREAKVQRQEAEAQRKSAEAGRLAVLADSLRKQGPTMLNPSTLLAVESTRLEPSLANESVLRAALNLLSKPASTLRLQGRVNSLAFSPDGRYVAAGSDDTAWVFAVGGAEGSQLDLQRPADAVAFSRKGWRYLTTVSVRTELELVLRIDPLQPQDLIDKACALLTANLTREEWNRFLPGEKYRKTCPNLP